MTTSATNADATTERRRRRNGSAAARKESETREANGRHAALRLPAPGRHPRRSFRGFAAVARFCCSELVVSADFNGCPETPNNVQHLAVPDGVTFTRRFRNRQSGQIARATGG